MEKPKSVPKAYKSAKEANEIMCLIRKMVRFGRVKILEVMEGGYRVKYNGNEITIADHEESHWAGSSGGGCGMGMELRQTISLTLVPESGIYQDRNAPEQFIEIMMFHEIREKEYAEAGFEDAHERALRDEALYILQHFTGEGQRTYLEWASEYRICAKVKAIIKLANPDGAQLHEIPFGREALFSWLKDRYDYGSKFRERPDDNVFSTFKKKLGENPSKIIEICDEAMWIQKQLCARCTDNSEAQLLVDIYDFNNTINIRFVINENGRDLITSAAISING